MIFDTKSVGMTPEILASNDYQAVPLKIDEASTVVKAGTPITNDGKKAADGTNAIGILLYDVDTARNPNGAVVVDGIINYDKAKANANTDLTASAQDLAKALPNLVIREKVSDKDSKTYTSGGVQASEAV